jgi:hypothetical protein
MIYNDRSNSKQYSNNSKNIVLTSTNKIDIPYDNKKTEYIEYSKNGDSRYNLLNNTYKRTSYRKKSPK